MFVVHKKKNRMMSQAIKKLKLSIDVETFSSVDISAGTHKYNTGSELLLFGYKFTGEEVEVIDVAQGGSIPDRVLKALTDPSIVKSAWNAGFEIEIIEKHLRLNLPLDQWECTMVKSAKSGYPLSLESASEALGLSKGKDPKGKALIRLFSVPRKPTKSNPATRVFPMDDPSKWAEFITYCKQDVVVEDEIDALLSKYPPQPRFESLMYVLDRQINRRGIGLDLDFINQAINLDSEYKDILLGEAKELTGLDNPNSVTQLKSWLREHTGKIWPSLDKQTVNNALNNGELPFVEEVVFSEGSPGYAALLAKWVKLKKNEGEPQPKSFTEEVADGSVVGVKLSPSVRRVLELRRELSNTSVKKYLTMLNSQVDGRIYDTLQFNGAGRTGRNAGRLIQPQNLPRVTLKDSEIDVARRMVLSGDLDLMLLSYESVSDILSQLIRSALKAAPGHRFIVCDLSAIEARVLAWFAGEEHVLEVFRTHGKIYEATAAMMFGVPFDSITKDSEMRQNGKTASLACGYQGGVNAITTMDVDGAIPDEVKPGLVQAWRKAHPATVRFWYYTQECAIKAIKNPGEKVSLTKGAYFTVRNASLLFYLPSGRYLTYPKVDLEDGKFGEKIVFWGVDPLTKKWTKLDTYGGKLVENLVQAFSRDILMYGMLNMVRKGYNLVTNVHDETVSEMPYGKGSVEEVVKLMCDMPSWAEGLPLRAVGFESEYYKK